VAAPGPACLALAKVGRGASLLGKLALRRLFGRIAEAGMLNGEDGS
jgi:hypothetical protein